VLAVIGAGVLLLLAGYGVASYGYVLIKGYNITPREWFSPLNPYQWPAPGATIPRVPQGSLFPTAKAPGSHQATATA
jgi:hypothetical protein